MIVPIKLLSYSDLDCSSSSGKQLKQALGSQQTGINVQGQRHHLAIARDTATSKNCGTTRRYSPLIRPPLNIYLAVNVVFCPSSAIFINEDRIYLNNTQQTTVAS